MSKKKTLFETSSKKDIQLEPKICGKHYKAKKALWFDSDRSLHVSVYWPTIIESSEDASKTWTTNLLPSLFVV